MQNRIKGLLGSGIAVLSCSLAAQVAKSPTPADGYTVHVSAPHVVNGKVMGPFQHYCKVMKPDPVIVCLIYDSTDSTATLTQIEYIIAKKLTRPAVPLADWNKYWHDHEAEISTGRVQMHDLPPDKAKEVATTDGIIFSLWRPEDPVPTCHVMVPQAVGHKPLSPAQYAQKPEGSGWPLA